MECEALVVTICWDCKEIKAVTRLDFPQYVLVGL
jgi:hypothetical protein